MEYLENQGFEPNPGFTTKFPPGTVIQTVSRDQQGNPVEEATPRVFLSKDSCYPTIEATSADAVLPQSSGSNTRALNIDATTLSQYLPQLALDATIMDSYSMVIDNPKVLLIPRGEMLGNMSLQCRKTLTFALKDGDKIEWFKIIDEVMVAQGFSLQVNWKTKGGAIVDIDTRKQELEKFQDVLSRGLGSEGKEPLFQVSDSNDRFAELTTDKELIFAFKARPLSIVNTE
jgi:hypothetical protein